MQWLLKNLYRPGQCSKSFPGCVTAESCPTQSCTSPGAGDELHIFNVVPSPQAKLLGAGVGLADAGEFMLAPSDPADDKKQVGYPLC